MQAVPGSPPALGPPGDLLDQIACRPEWTAQGRPAAQFSPEPRQVVDDVLPAAGGEGSEDQAGAAGTPEPNHLPLAAFSVWAVDVAKRSSLGFVQALLRHLLHQIAAEVGRRCRHPGLLRGEPTLPPAFQDFLARIEEAA